MRRGEDLLTHEEAERARDEAERARDEAERVREEETAARRAAEARVAELEARLDQVTVSSPRSALDDEIAVGGDAHGETAG